MHTIPISELGDLPGLFTTVDHITVTETNPATGTTDAVTLPPPLIRRTTRRDGTTAWILTPPGIAERIHIEGDQTPVTVHYKPVPAPAVASPTPAPAPAPAGAPHQQQTAWTHPAPQTPYTPAPAPARPAAPWTTPPPRT
ncbi:hypothetical protein OIE69_44455 (plasmid) [Actinacidiphila glaucinigra]|uniref:hypothetical protein n=1 Tax=Actinacidiphila glaucinigra TaxID=235986 RepID=UPI002DDB5D83|nr:hypothetical protein [Actinacidiphila glaucinigra]WSD65754.1 hypothetical protein OIE69_43395 [Actinacidiphila glaucinigra]WSD65958.1 hypothetical protein OIE69_44455 [Actinacidiphila glaucinigra]